MLFQLQSSLWLLTCESISDMSINCRLTQQ